MIPGAHRPYFMPNPLMGFHLPEFYPSRDSERLSTPGYRLNLILNENHLEIISRLATPESIANGDFHGFAPFGSPYASQSG
jgi:hypothetical protein